MRRAMKMTPFLIKLLKEKAKAPEMKEIDQKLEQWISNSIVRAEIRALIIKEIDSHQDLRYLNNK